MSSVAFSIASSMVIPRRAAPFTTRTGSFQISGNIFVGWMYALITAQAMAAAGPEVDRTLQWLLLVPVYASQLDTEAKRDDLRMQTLGTSKISAGDLVEKFSVAVPVMSMSVPKAPYSSPIV